GLQHEEQHQELILTDVKHLLSLNPLRPAYREARRAPAREPSRGTAPLAFVPHAAGLVSIGHAGPGFAFDNESPRHAVHLEPFELASRPATAGEYLAFMEDGGYGRPEMWLSDGWDSVQREAWRAPLYWERVGGRWNLFTLDGPRELDAAEPVCHVSYYEADAFARWSGARLAREGEWEAVAAGRAVEGNFAESGALHPRPAPAAGDGPQALFGDVWEWTQSAYAAYPGYQPPQGALGEYNGKFMCNQLVLRGGSCASPRGHLRASYRNFFRPEARWQFTGIRLARDA
ncbi:MAG TPA: ergothioneine biosynthesis protein EgtB, partial [Planctomycetota bacterium]|nr:ergothioneine biosynthesis protein EgtB [Planctomycetota bacterium]